jgi:hypothetical protein
VAIWYIGPINGSPALDYLGATLEAVARGLPLCYLALTLALLAAALVGRRRQLNA